VDLALRISTDRTLHPSNGQLTRSPGGMSTSAIPGRSAPPHELSGSRRVATLTKRQERQAGEQPEQSHHGPGQASGRASKKK